MGSTQSPAQQMTARVSKHIGHGQRDPQCEEVASIVTIKPALIPFKKWETVCPALTGWSGREAL
jgi:hypothetical protein